MASELRVLPLSVWFHLIKSIILGTTA